MKKLVIFLHLGLLVVTSAFASQKTEVQTAVEKFKQENPYSLLIVQTFLSNRTFDKNKVVDMMDLTISKGKDIFSSNIDFKTEFSTHSLSGTDKKAALLAVLNDSEYDKPLDAFTQCTRLGSLKKGWCHTYIDPQLFAVLEKEHKMAQSK